MEKPELSKLLKSMAEETIFSAKGHFKSCDLRRNAVTYTIWGCVIFNIIGLIGIHPIVDKWLSAAGLFGTIVLLIWNEGEGKNYRAKHKEAGEKYLALHKKIRMYFSNGDFIGTEIEALNSEVTDLDRSEKPEIPRIARKQAKKAIEGDDPETDNWFKES